MRRLLGNGPIVGTLAIGEIAGMAELSLFVALNAMNGFAVSAAAGLFFLRIRHVDRFGHFTR